MVRGISLAFVVMAAISGCGGGGASDGGSASQSISAGVKAFSVSPEAVASDLSVAAIVKVSELRVSRTVFDYVYRVTVRNTGATAYSNVTITLASVGAGATIVGRQATVAAVAAGATATSTDTVTIRQDRTVAFEPSALVWQLAATVSAQSQLAALEDSGRIPKLERGDTLDGVDSNGNGVRDDVEAYIASHYPTGAPQAAALQLAKAFQSSLHIASTDVPGAKAVSVRVSNATGCVFDKFPIGGGIPPGQVVSELEAVTTNTKPRLLAYLGYNKALDGTASSLPTGDTCA